MPSRPTALLSFLCAFVIVLQPAFASKEPFSVDDYFKIKGIAELSLSPDGEMIAYVTTSQSLDQNKPKRAVYVSKVAFHTEPQSIENIADARGISWIPGKSELAFLSDRSGSTQVHAYDLESKTVRQLTQSDEAMVQYGFAPDGKSLAYITQKNAGPTLYSRLHTGKEGVVVDPEILRVQYFTDPNIFENPSRMQHLWLLRSEDEAVRVEVSGSVDDFHWASNSSKLSVTYGTPSTSLLSLLQKSVGVYDLPHNKFRTLFPSTPARFGDSGRGYVGEGWLPGEDKLILLRHKLAHWYADSTHPDWTIVDVSKARPSLDKGQIWREISRTGSDAAPLFYPLPNLRVLINATARGGYRSVYEATEVGKPARVLKPSDVAGDVTGKISKLRITTDGNLAVFVNESLDKAPEIYVWRKGQGSTQLTRLNEGFSGHRMPVVQEIDWKSKDGTEVQGWLLLPKEPDQDQAPWPMITFIHGGPTSPMPVGFASYFRNWPYPFKVYALNGMAVFLPNYRGTATFGRSFVTPSRQDGEPVDDIVSGIQQLVRQGIADPTRLAISGHSHGAWLGPMVMTRTGMFQAGSFADGWGNSVTEYDIAPGSQTRAINDVVNSVSLYDEPDRYLQLSPSLHFKGLSTAVLFEAGNRSLPIHMMGYAKAAKYAGMPTEFVIYPHTGHNPAIPTIQRESAERNLDWFRFWLKDYEDDDPAKAEQYARWRKMRDERCVWDEPEAEKPSYCEYSNAVQ